MRVTERRYVYRLFDVNGALLYVGCTKDIQRRLRSHRFSKPWWPRVSILESEPMGWHQAWLTEQNLIRSGEAGEFNVTQRESGTRAARTRRETAIRQHVIGGYCGRSNCKTCRERRAKRLATA